MFQRWKPYPETICTISKTKDVCHVNSFCCSLLMSVQQILKERGRGRRRGWGEMKVVYDLSLVCACACVSPISKGSVCNLFDVIMLVLSQRFKDKSKQTICRLISLKNLNCGAIKTLFVWVPVCLNMYFWIAFNGETCFSHNE